MRGKREWFIGVDFGDGEETKDYLNDRDTLEVLLNGNSSRNKAENLAKAILVCSSDVSEARKALALQGLFPNAEELKKAFISLEVRTFDEEVMQYYHILSSAYQQYKIYDETGISKNAKEEVEKEEKARKLAEARIFAEDYIADHDSYNTEKFLAKKGVAPGQYDDLILLLRAEDPERYNKYLDVAAKNTQTRIDLGHLNMAIVHKGITTGLNEKGEPFDLSDFCRYFPYLSGFSSTEGLRDNNVPGSATYSVRIRRLLNTIYREYADATIKYISDNRITEIAVSPITEDEIKRTKETVNGVEVTEEMKKQILAHMAESDVPMVRIAYSSLRNKLLNDKSLPQPVTKIKEIKSN